MPEPAGYGSFAFARAGRSERDGRNGAGGTQYAGRVPPANEPRPVALIAVQARLHPDRYRSEAAYRAWIADACARAVAGLPPAAEVPRLIAFPELIGAPLAWALNRPADPRDADRAWHRVLQNVREAPGTVARAAIRFRRFGPSLLHHPRAELAGRVHHRAFSDAAREARATVVAGTILGPPVDHEPARGWHVTHGPVRNRALVFGPGGGLLGASDKAFLTPGAESRIGLSPGRLEDLRPLATPVGPVGVAVCLDAFHEEAVGRLDGQGATVLVQPSANPVPWTRRWPHDPALSEGEAWWRHGLPRLLRERTHLRAGVNPMAVGDAFGLRPRGRSTVVVAGAPGVHGLPDGIVAAAPNDVGEAIVRTVASLPLGYDFRPT